MQNVHSRFALGIGGRDGHALGRGGAAQIGRGGQSGKSQGLAITQVMKHLGKHKRGKRGLPRGLPDCARPESDKARENAGKGPRGEVCRVLRRQQVAVGCPQPYKARDNAGNGPSREVCRIVRAPNPTKLAKTPEKGPATRFVGLGAGCRPTCAARGPTKLAKTRETGPPARFAGLCAS